MPRPSAAPDRDGPPASVQPAGLGGGVLLAVLLTGVAGYVDAVSFLAFGGVYASFMSGDTTQLGAALGQGERGPAILFLSVAALFVTGVVAGRVLWSLSRRWGRSAVLLLVALLLAGAAASTRTSGSAAALILAVLAMGAQNAVIHRAGSAPVSPTFVTGALVRVGEALADRLTGRGRGPLWSQLLQWLGLATGAAMGAHAYATTGAEVLVRPALAALGLAAALAIGESFRRVSRRADP